jgi:hypothetical protein
MVTVDRVYLSPRNRAEGTGELLEPRCLVGFVNWPAQRRMAYDIQVMTGGREPKQCGGSMGAECEDRRFYRNIKCSAPPEWRGGLIAFPVAS